MLLLWASSKLPGLLTKAEQAALRSEAYAAQQPDGGFTLSAMLNDWVRKDKTPLETKSDGYATGVVVLALKASGASPQDEHLKSAIHWLETNQQPEGPWLSYSANKQRDLSSDVGKFMLDAATAYSILALMAH